MEKKADVKEDETEERIALEGEKQLQEFIELPKKERKKAERDINGRFKKALKKNDARGTEGETEVAASAED